MHSANKLSFRALIADCQQGVEIVAIAVDGDQHSALVVLLAVLVVLNCGGSSGVTASLETGCFLR